MSPPDDKPAFDPADAFDIDTDEGLEAFVVDLHRREGIPERLRYPETAEAYDRMIAEAEASGFVPADEVEAWLASLGTANPLPRPRPK